MSDSSLSASPSLPYTRARNLWPNPTPTPTPTTQAHRPQPHQQRMKSESVVTTHGEQALNGR